MIKYTCFCDCCNKELFDISDLYECRMPFIDLENKTIKLIKYELCSSCLNSLNNYINSYMKERKDEND